MLDLLKTLITHQYDAALCTLNTCIEHCPDRAWDAPVASLAYCQAVFHTLFFTDLYLGRDEASLRAQPFHQDNPAFFRTYEELEPRRQELLYDRVSLARYLEHCRTKVRETIAGEDAQSLSGPSGFPRRTVSRAELHVVSIRHIQHHAAQLRLRLRLDFDVDLPWFESGWRDVPNA